MTLDFRMSSTCLFSDIVLPTATWYEKDDMNTSDMHPFIHPLSAAVNPAWESRSDWEIYKVSPKHFRKCAWVILAKKPTWYYNPYCMTLRQSSHSRVKCSTGAKANAI